MRGSPASARPLRQRGLSLVEIVVTLSIAALLVGVGAPALQKVVAVQRMRGASFDLVSDLSLARSEALKRGTRVQLLPQGAGWGEGWKVVATGVTEPLAERPAPGVTVTTAPAGVTFDVSGRVLDTDDTVRFGLADGQRARCISLDPAGRPRTSETECPA